jgi:phage FluMu gp28-like protein
MLFPHKLNLWQFQRGLLEDPARFIAVMWARGNGKSKITALKIILDILWNETKNTPSDWLIISANADQAKEALRLVESWARVIYAIAAKVKIISQEVELRTPEGLERYTRYELRIGSRSKVMALCASPRAVRGYTCNAWWDEACFFDEDHEMWQAVQHVTRGRLRVIVSSTPIGGPEKKFYDIINSQVMVRGKKLWSQHVCDIYEACKQGRGLIYDLETEEAASESDAWATEMMLQWIDPKSTWFEMELLDNCKDVRASADGEFEYAGGRCYVGNDIGRRGDRWVAWVVEDVSGTFITREVSVLDNAKYKKHDAEIARLFAKYNVMRLCMDQTGIGDRSTEEMIDIYGSRVEGVNFNANNKEDMATLAKKTMKERRLLLPMKSPEIIQDIRRLQKTVSTAGAVRFNAVRDKFGHADRAWAMMLALNAAVTPVIEIEVRTDNNRVNSSSQMRGWI